MKKLLVFYTILVAFSAAPCFAQNAIEVERKFADGEYFLALENYLRIPKRQATIDSAISAGRSAWALGLTQMAQDEFERVLRTGRLSNADSARIYLSQGIIEYQEARYQSAQMYAEKAAALLSEPSNLRSQIWLLWAESLDKLRQLGQAETYYLTALQEANMTDRYEVSYALALCQFNLGKFKEAQEHFEMIPLEHLRSAEAIHYLARISLERKDYDALEFWLNKGMEIAPQSFKDGWTDYALIQVATYKNDLDKVQEVLSNAKNKYPPSDHWYMLIESAAESFKWRSLVRTSLKPVVQTTIAEYKHKE